MERFDVDAADLRIIRDTEDVVVTDMRRTLASIFGYRQDADPITPSQAAIIVDVISFHLELQQFLGQKIGNDQTEISHAPHPRGSLSPFVIQGWIRVMSSLHGGKDITADLALHTDHFFHVHGAAVSNAHPGKSGVLQFADLTSGSLLQQYTGALAARLLIKEYVELQARRREPEGGSRSEIDEKFSFSLFDGLSENIFAIPGVAENFVRTIEEAISSPDWSYFKYKDPFSLFRHLDMVDRISMLTADCERFNSVLNQDNVRLTDAIAMLSPRSAQEILDRDIETLFPSDSGRARAGLHAVLETIIDAKGLDMERFGEMLARQLSYSTDDVSVLSEFAGQKFRGLRNAPIKRELVKAMGSIDVVNDFLTTLKREFPRGEERTRAIELIAAMCRPYREGMNPSRHREFMLDARDATRPVVARGVSVTL